MDAQLTHGNGKAPLMLVELFALPGAGKSTVAEALAKQALITTRKDLTAAWANTPRLQRLAHLGRALGNYGRLKTAIRFALAARLDTREGHFRLMRLVAKTEWLRSRTGVVLLDQGFLQDIWSIILSSSSGRADPALLSPLIRSLYEGIDATIVVLEVDLETAAKRVSARTYGRSRFDGLAEGELRSSITAASGRWGPVMGAARLAGLTVLSVDASPPAQVVTEKILALFPAMRMKESAQPTSPRPHRISVVGASGSGKTVLAREIADCLNLPHLELDRIRRQAIDQASPERTFESCVAELTLGDRWIIDGHYREVRDLIWRRSEVVVWLNYPLRLVAMRVLKRFRAKRSATASRADQIGETVGMAPQVAVESASWQRRFGRLVRTLRERDVYGRLLRRYPNVEIVELRSIKATRQWLRDL